MHWRALFQGSATAAHQQMPHSLLLPGLPLACKRSPSLKLKSSSSSSCSSPSLPPLPGPTSDSKASHTMSIRLRPLFMTSGATHQRRQHDARA